MIICPNCNEEIEESSRYCDQCGKELLYCNRCGRVGLGRRCTSCGGLMVSPEESQKSVTSFESQVSMGMSQSSISNMSFSRPVMVNSSQKAQGMPLMTLINNSLNIHIDAQNGAVIGRRQGPYVQFFQNNMYVSGVHAQLRYKAGAGWCIVDMHSSNGTKLNGHPLQPDAEMSLKDGDIVMVANVNLQVIIK